ncbi:Hypothetical protein NTJ_11180 [Nesidiocoris tenuis]|uniref:Uncharacterized protein n=1 Tax=Nesidiocoris tenuis TaxID=355587 RepID=A0ABN7B1S2_9HEMI|nr:Hypothetical protein NTJ_11180 [Nesidiocoris tenuis]
MLKFDTQPQRSLSARLAGPKYVLIRKNSGLASHAEGSLGGSIPNFSIVRPTVLDLAQWAPQLIGKYFGLASHAEGLLGGSIPNFSIVRPTVLDLAQWAPQLIRKNFGLASHAEGLL